MTRARSWAAALPPAVWSAVAGLVLLASVGLALVLGAGITVWRGAVGSAGPPAVVVSPPRSGLVLVPAHHAPATRPHGASVTATAPRTPAGPAAAANSTAGAGRPVAPAPAHVARRVGASASAHAARPGRAVGPAVGRAVSRVAGRVTGRGAATVVPAALPARAAATTPGLVRLLAVRPQVAGVRGTTGASARPTAEVVVAVTTVPEVLLLPETPTAPGTTVAIATLTPSVRPAIESVEPGHCEAAALPPRHDRGKAHARRQHGWSHLFAAGVGKHRDAAGPQVAGSHGDELHGDKPHGGKHRGDRGHA